MKNIKWGNKELPGLSNEDLNKMTHRSLVQAETMRAVNNRRTPEEYAKIIAKSAASKDQVAAANKRWANASEESRKTNMDAARHKAYENFAKQKEERYSIILKEIPDGEWISRKKWCDWYTQSNYAKEWGHTTGQFMAELISNPKYFESNGHSNSRWIKFRKI